MSTWNKYANVQQSPMMDFIERCARNTETSNSVLLSALKTFSPTKHHDMMTTDGFFDDCCRNKAETNDSSSDSATSPTEPCPTPQRRSLRQKRTTTRRKLLLDASPSPSTSPQLLSSKPSPFTNLIASPGHHTPKRPRVSTLTSPSKFAKRLRFSSVEASATPVTCLSSRLSTAACLSTPPQPQTIQSPSPRETQSANLLTSYGDTSDDLLPTVSGKVGDVKSISGETMADLLTGRLHTDAHVTIVDCRYPYEYDGGHINGAINLFTKDEVTQHFFSPTNENTNQEQVIIFHCEFSSERGPKMYRHLRSQDRHVNAVNYPHLSYPHIYLLDSGYSAFYPNHKDLCTLGGYTSMFDHAHKQDLRKFRAKSKSFPAPKTYRHNHSTVRTTLAF